jgi:hypothetical protein
MFSRNAWPLVLALAQLVTQSSNADSCQTFTGTSLPSDFALPPLNHNDKVLKISSDGSLLAEDITFTTGTDANLTIAYSGSFDSAKTTGPVITYHWSANDLQVSVTKAVSSGAGAPATMSAGLVAVGLGAVLSSAMTTHQPRVASLVGLGMVALPLYAHAANCSKALSVKLNVTLPATFASLSTASGNAQMFWFALLTPSPSPTAAPTMSPTFVNVPCTSNSNCVTYVNTDTHKFYVSSSTCTAGRCQTFQCVSGHQDCDSYFANGCEFPSSSGCPYRRD